MSGFGQVFGLDRLRGPSDDQCRKDIVTAFISRAASSDHLGVYLRDLSFNSISMGSVMERIFLDAASDVCVSTQSFVVYFDDPVEPIDIEADQDIIKLVDDEMGPLAPRITGAKWWEKGKTR